MSAGAPRGCRSTTAFRAKTAKPARPTALRFGSALRTTPAATAPFMERTADCSRSPSKSTARWSLRNPHPGGVYGFDWEELPMSITQETRRESNVKTDRETRYQKILAILKPGWK